VSRRQGGEQEGLRIEEPGGHIGGMVEMFILLVQDSTQRAGRKGLVASASPQPCWACTR
jgi:hypothetical protein